MTKYCDSIGQKLPCPHPDDCTVSCGDIATRKIKPYPAIAPAPVDDEELFDDQWQVFGTFMLSVAMLILVVFFVTMFMTGVWIWGMLV